MARTKGNPYSKSKKFQLQSNPSTSSESGERVRSQQPSTSGPKRRLDFDSLIESGTDESKDRKLQSEQAKKMRTRSGHKLKCSSKIEPKDQPGPSSQPSTSGLAPAGKSVTFVSQPQLEYLNASELPTSTWQVVKDLEWCVVNSESLLNQTKEVEGSIYFESPLFHEFLEVAGLEVMGDVDVRLECGEILHLEDALYIESAKCNLISVNALKSQSKNPIRPNSKYCLRTGNDHLYLFDERNGERIQLTRKIANRTVLLTKKPTIQEIIDHATEHRVRDSKAAWIKEL